MTMTTLAMESDFLSPTQASIELRVSAARIRQMIDEGKLPAIVTPLGRLIPADAVEKLRQEREARNAA